MPKSQNQKLKLLRLKDILFECTDEAHPMTVAEMIAALGLYGISADRKTIYDDIEALRLYGLDIEKTRSKSTGYYVASRDFELPELKLLVDSVQSSKFITHKKTLELIKKIEGLSSTHNAQLLQRQVYVRNRVKTMNESVYYNVDEISGAISNDRAIRFKYYEYSINKEYQFRKNGKFYEVSPFALMWDDENYYLVAWDAEAQKMKHYRIDKMKNISATETARLGKEHFENEDMSEYSKKMFGMFTGEEQSLRLRFDNKLIGAVIDRFGKDINIIPLDEEHFSIYVNVAVSPQFYAWLFAFGPGARILSPDSARYEMKKQCQIITYLY